MGENEATIVGENKVQSRFILSNRRLNPQTKPIPLLNQPRDTFVIVAVTKCEYLGMEWICEP